MSRLVALLALLAAPLAAQTVDDGYEVGTWHGFRDAAVTHTFDDNTSNQVPVAIPLFDEFGFDATFFVVTNWGPNWAGFSAAAENGHEITSHTVSHPQVASITEQQQDAELTNSKATIQANVPGAEVLTLAYPYCSRWADAVTSATYIAARGCSGQIVPSTPADFLNISSIIVGSEGAVQTAADLNARVDAAAGSGGWAVFLLHGIDGDGGYSPTDSDELRGHLEYLDANRDRFWVDTFENVVRYIRERDAATVTEVSVTDETVTVEVSDGDLDDAIYTVPLSIRRALPEGWEAATATQGGEPVGARVVEGTVEFEAVPDGGPVVLTRSEPTSAAPEPHAPELIVVGNQPNPFRGETTVVFDVPEQGPVTVEVYDLLGRRLETLVDKVLSAGRNVVTWDASPYGAGTYTYRVRLGDRVGAGQAVHAR